MKLISLIAALVFAQAAKSPVEVRSALDSYKGDVILLDFWATWCAPCRKQIPEFIRLYDRYKSRGVVVIGVSVDESPAAVEKFVKELHVNYPILRGGAEGDLQKAFGPPGFPTLYIIDRAGQIRSQHTGLISMEEVERTIDLLL